jgi:putative sigma-54 modulation protein
MTVPVEISTKNMELNDRLREYVEKKAEKLDRYLDVIDSVKVDLTYAQSARSAEDRQVAQLTVRGKGVMLRAEERTEDIFASVDLVLDKIYRQIERYKGRRWRGRGDGKTISEATMPPTTIEEIEEPEGLDLIARRKHHLLIPMDEVEAIEQMELLDHEDFFVFLNVNTDQVNILYRRRNGTLGLIETEIA